MKASNAMIPAVLALLLAAVDVQAQVQAMPSGAAGSAGRADAMRPGTVAPLPAYGRPPFFVKRPLFFRHPFFFGSGHRLASTAYSIPQAYVYSYPYPVYVQVPDYGQGPAQYWAYCRSPQGYYPYVAECPAGWLPVAPTSPPPPLVPGQTAMDAGPPPKDPPSGGDSIEEIRARIARSRAD